jgi:hypothetical protein
LLVTPYAPELGGGARRTIDIVRAYWKSKRRP